MASLQQLSLKVKKTNRSNEVGEVKKKSKVLVMIESVPVEVQTSKNGKQRKVGYIKMVVVDDLKANTITQIVKANIANNTVIDSDNSNSYVKLKDIAMEHKPEIIPKEKVNEMLPWVHIAISNAKRLYFIFIMIWNPNTCKAISMSSAISITDVILEINFLTVY